MRFVAANTHADHDAIAAFRRVNQSAIAVAFFYVLLLARETGLPQRGTVLRNLTDSCCGVEKVKMEWGLAALAYFCTRQTRLNAAQGRE